jgi:ribosomal protein S19
LQKKPDAIKNATEKILQKLKELKETIKDIDYDTVEKWVRDLVIVKTFIGLRFQPTDSQQLSITIKLKME